MAAGKLAAMRRLSTLSAAAGLGAVGALHAIWATGSAWPLRDKRQLTDHVISRGSESQRFRRLDRRIYSPLCLTLAALALPAVFGSAR